MTEMQSEAPREVGAAADAKRGAAGYPPPPTRGRRLTVAQAAGLQLVPGAATLLATLVLGWAGAPHVFALPLAVLFGDAPVSWLIMRAWTRRETGGTASWPELFPWRARNPYWVYLISLPLVAASMAAVGIGMTVLPRLLGPFFAWLPEVLRADISPEAMAALPRGQLLALWVLMLLAFPLVGGVTQELYSRGFLLPRTAHLGRIAPLLNAVWFAVYHLNAPWAWPAFFVMTTAWAYMVWWRRSVRIGLFLHVGMLFIQWLLMTMVVFGAMPAPPG